MLFVRGAFKNYDPSPSPYVDSFYIYPERGQKQTYFDPLPPHLVHVVIEWPLKSRISISLLSIIEGVVERLLFALQM